MTETKEDEVKKSELLSRISELLLSKELADVTFAVSNKGGKEQEFPAHKLVLALSSPHFRKLFYESKETTSKITIKDTDPEVFKQVLTYIYRETVETKTDDIPILLAAGKTFDVPALRAFCGTFMTGSMNVDNAMTLFETAPTLIGDPKWGLKFIGENTADILATPGFLALSKERLKVLLGADELGVSETELFQAVIKWSEAEAKRQNKTLSSEVQAKILEDVLPLIRFPTMETGDVATVVAPTNLISSDALVQLYMYVSVEDEKVRSSLSVPFPTKPRQMSSLGTWDPNQSWTHNLYDVTNKGRTAIKARNTSTIYVIREMPTKKRATEFTIRMKIDAKRGDDTYNRIGLTTDRNNYNDAYINGSGSICFQPSDGQIFIDGAGSGQRLTPIKEGSIVVIKVNQKKKSVTFDVDKKALTVTWGSLIENENIYGAVCFRAQGWQATLF